MKKNITISILVLMLVQNLVAQEMMYIPENAGVFLGDANPIGIFGNLRNDGNLGIKKNGNLYFMGKIWMNEKTSKITDGGMVTNSISGGTIHFLQSNALYGNLGQQILHPGYSEADSCGVTFSNITIDNSAGVIITGDIRVRNTLHFKRGHLFLNTYNYVAGDSTFTGQFTGFAHDRYVVTGTGTHGSMIKYFKVNTGSLVTFPMGPAINMYAPMQLINNGTPDAFMSRSFGNVYTKAISGPMVTDSVVNLTWTVLKKIPGLNEVVVRLQHDMQVEDGTFRPLRNSSFISLYDSATGWDKPLFSPFPQMPGNITSTVPNISSQVNSRKIFICSDPMYLTKKVSNKKASLVIPNAFSPNGDGINDTWNLKGLSDFDRCVVEIFNRYGQSIFISYGYRSPWDGTFNGKPVPVGVYYYVIDVKNGEKPYSGSLTLLR